MGSLADFSEIELLDHVCNAAYTPPATMYLGLSLAYSVRTASYKWTLSSGGTTEYYLELAAGGNPNLGGDPEACIINNSVATKGTVGSLAAGEWGYEDNDTLGFNTLYVRLSDGTDPDTKALDYILAGGNPHDDASKLNEPSVGAYARKAITFAAAASRQVAQNADVDFDQASATWGWVTHWGIFDALSSGNMMAAGKLTEPKQVVSGNTPSIASAEVTVSFNAGYVSDYLANKLLDLMFRNQAYSAPDTYCALPTATVADDDTGSTITEHSGDAYARKQVNINGGASPTWDLAASSIVDNTHNVDFVQATGSWGTIVALAIVDAATLGNLLFYDNGVADQAVGNGDTVRFPAGDLDISMS